MSIPVTAHFSIDEFNCHDGTPYPREWIGDRLLPLCRVLEALRDELGGKPVTILSGYRTPAHNEALRDADGSGTGVAKNSQHLVGRAADITVKGCTPAEVHEALLRLDAAGKIGIGGLGLYQRWVHVDIRDRAADGHLARWNGPGVDAAAA